MKALWNLGFFDKPYSALDYGCGQADDVSILQEKNISIKRTSIKMFMKCTSAKVIT